MSELQELKEYIKKIKFKKVVMGGYSKKDVQNKMDTLYQMVDHAMIEYNARELELIKQYEDKINCIIESYENKKNLTDKLIVDLNKSLCELTEEKERLQEEQIEIKKTCETHCKNMLNKYQSSLKKLSSELARVLENMSILF